MFAECLSKQVKVGKLSISENFVCDSLDEIIRENKIHKLFLEIISSSQQQSKELAFIYFPRIKTDEEIAGLVRFLSLRQPFWIDNDDSYHGKLLNQSNTDQKLFEAIPLRISLDAINDINSWPMIMTSSNYTPASRKQSITTFIFRPIVGKHNTTTPHNQIGIDDTKTGVSSVKMFEKLLNQTHLGVTKTVGDFNRKLFRARSAVVIPKDSWEITLKSNI
jgi:hypothetical protein